MAEIKAQITLTPKEMELVNRKRIQEKHVAHMIQEIMRLTLERNIKNTQIRLMRDLRDDILKMTFTVGDIAFEIKKKDKLIKELHYQIERLDFRLKPLNRQLQLSKELVARIDKELLASIKKRGVVKDAV